MQSSCICHPATLCPYCICLIDTGFCEETLLITWSVNSNPPSHFPLGQSTPYWFCTMSALQPCKGTFFKVAAKPKWVLRFPGTPPAPCSGPQAYSTSSRPEGRLVSAAWVFAFHCLIWIPRTARMALPPSCCYRFPAGEHRVWDPRDRKNFQRKWTQAWHNVPCTPNVCKSGCYRKRC